VVIYDEQKNKTTNKAGCDIIYRAYIDQDISIIERAMKLPHVESCYIEGYSFLDDGERVWYIMYLNGVTDFLLRSWSDDGKEWSEPELFTLPGPHPRRGFITPHGEYGITCFDILEKDLFLYASVPWKDWEKEKIFRSKKGIMGATITCTDAGEMWGIIDTGGRIVFIHPSQESEQRYNNKLISMH